MNGHYETCNIRLKRACWPRNVFEGFMIAKHSRVNARQGRVRKQVLAASRRLPSPSYPPPCLSRHFVLGQGRGSRALCKGFRGSRARAGALCPWPKGSPRVPLGSPWSPRRHMSRPLDVFEGFSGATSKSRKSEAVKLE